MDDVEAEVTELRPPEERIHVGAVAVDEAARLVNDAAHLDGVAVEEAEGCRLGEHDAREVLAGLGADGVEVDVTAGRGGDRDDLEAGHGRGRGVGAVSGVRDEHLAAMSVAARVERRAEGEDACELALRSRERGEAGAGQAADLLQVGLQGEHGLQASLDLRLGLRGVREREAGCCCDGLVQLGVVLHRAAAEGVEVGVDGEVQLAEVREVADDLALGDLRQLQIVAEHRLLRHELRRHVGRGERDAGASGAAALHEQPAAVVCFLAERGVGHGGHRPISASASTRRSIWSRVLTSVTQSSMPFG